ncbi:MAG: alanine--tRNA ligase [Elusimicrobiota bacterium]
MITGEIRNKYLKFFESKGHTVKQSASLIPSNDPSLLFTSAGMVPFKDLFLGKVKAEYTRAVSIQKCVRTTDIDNIGHTSRHLTFFEMMGNFSFGDYFKEDAINWAWEFFIDVLKLPKEKLYVTVFKDDDESFNLWEKLIDSKRIYKLGEDTNFWAIGDTGPCGPCSEILFDMGKEMGCGKKDCKPGCDCDRYLEVWNLVFTEFDKQKDGSLKPLPGKNIDTGMGLERLASVVQGVHSPYETDVFRNIYKRIEELGKKQNASFKVNETAFRIISDHARTATFLLADGVTPSNEGRGYVLKRLIRRAVRQGHIIGLNNFFHEAAHKVIDEMRGAYPYISEKGAYIEEILKSEESKFKETLETGIKLIDELKAKYSKDKIFPGNELFKLFDTYGLPLDFARDIARDEGYDIDEKGFYKAMEEQKKHSRKNVEGWGEDDKLISSLQNKVREVIFAGYDKEECNSEIVDIIQKDKEVNNIKKGDEDTALILSVTPFYPESGGQSCDVGIIISKNNARFEVTDTKKPAPGIIVHYGSLVEGELAVGDSVIAKINIKNREDIRRNHTATHLLQAVLRKILGPHVAQQGSLVSSGGFRFDFTHPKAIPSEEIMKIEDGVNEIIQSNYLVNSEEMSINDAQKKGALAFFGEKYGEKVRVVSLSCDEKISMELCGGTHAKATGEIGLFVIVSESGIAGGVRRIEAVTGRGAIEWLRKQRELLQITAKRMKSSVDEIPAQAESLIKKIKDQDKEMAELKMKIMKYESASLIEKAEDMGGVKVLSHIVSGMQINEIRSLCDMLKGKIGSGIVFIILENEGGSQLICSITSDLVKNKKLDAKALLMDAASKFGGGGGGRPDMAQAGLKTKIKSEEIIKEFKKIIKEALENIKQ